MAILTQSTLETSSARPIRMAIGVAVFAILTALSAKVQVVLPGTPVPFTFQPLLVRCSRASRSSTQAGSPG